MEKDTIWEAHIADEPAGIEEEPLIPPDDHEHRVMLCRSCHLPRVFHRRRTRHSFHFAFALGTLGLWLPVWGIILILHRFKPWACAICGVHQQDV